MQLPSKFLTDPLIHQDILLTNGDLPSEDGLVKKWPPVADTVENWRDEHMMEPH